MADVLIEPDVGHIHWADFSAHEECIAAGEAAAAAALPELHRILQRERWRHLLRPGPCKRIAQAQMERSRVPIVVL